jgi:hypothetical protein
MLAASRRSRTSTPPDSPVHAGFKVQIFGEYMELPVATTVVRTALARCRYSDASYSLDGDLGWDSSGLVPAKVAPLKRSHNLLAFPKGGHMATRGRATGELPHLF